MTEVYQLFYQVVQACFTNFNKLLQGEEPLIHKLCDSEQRFMPKLASRFINPSVIQNHKDLGNSFSTLSSDRQNDTEAILQIFNRTHKTFVQDPYILNAVEEFLDYQAFSNHDIPENIWESAKISNNGHQMDVIWDHLKAKFPYLTKNDESVLVVPHSNLIEERVFLII